MFISQYYLSLIPNLLYATLNFRSDRGHNIYFYIDSENLLRVMSFLFLHHNSQLKSFCDLVGVDFPEKLKRFQLVYNLLSHKYHTRAFLVSWTDELSTVSSASSIFPASVWYEREVWDLFGVHFTNNADLRRILTDYSFYGHPLRKDFPLTGFVELFYNYRVDSIIYREVSLLQEYRNFQSDSPWNFFEN